MKTKGSKFELEAQRNADLMRAIRDHLAAAPYVSLPTLFAEVVMKPARRFWISEERATIVISAMLRGSRLRLVTDTKREMLAEILRRVKEQRRLHPEKSLAATVAQVVSRPAPKFYLTPGTAKAIYYKIKKKHRPR